jgi:hypothetical protein
MKFTWPGKHSLMPAPELRCTECGTALKEISWHAPGTTPHWWCPQCVEVFAVNPNTPNLLKPEVELIPCDDQSHFIPPSLLPAGNFLRMPAR